MKIDLCRLFGVTEGEEFKVDGYVNWFSNFKFKVRDNALLCSKLMEDDFTVCGISLNELKYIKEIIKLPKKKQFTDDELCVLRNIDKKYKWITRDESGNLCVFVEKPYKREEIWENEIHTDYIEFHCYNHLFNSIKWEDEEPIRIDDYVER